MSFATQVSIAGITTIIFLVVLFAVEDRHERRFLEKLRTGLDSLVTALSLGWHASMLYVGGGAIRVLLHRIIHTFLGAIRAALRFLERRIQQLQRRNKRVVRSVQAARTETHLSAIEEHRRATALSPEEKQVLKDKSLSG